jgi:hypothetical protein
MKFSKIMFNSEDFVCCGSLFDNKVMRFEDGVGSMFYTINPIDGRNDHGYKEKDKYDYLTPRRADINVSRFSNFMFEMDNISLDDQRKILENCGVNWSAIVYSGGKSLHALLSVNSCLGGCHTKEGIDNYKLIWKRLSGKVEEFAKTLGFDNVIDPSGKNPSRFTRYPGTIRDNGNEQTIEYLGSKLSLEEFNKLLESCPRVFTSVVTHSGNLRVKDIEEFFRKAPKALVEEVKYPTNLSSSGMYPLLFRLSTWARDLGVDKDIWKAVLEYRMYPSLINIGYPEHKLYTAVEHAYSK